MNADEQVRTDEHEVENMTEATGNGADASDVTTADTSAVPDADAPPAAGEETRPEQSPEDLVMIEEIEEAMRDVVDPELGINVVDLGLVYDIWIEDHTIARLDMTLTSAACPLQDVIEDQALQAVVGEGPAADLKINWIWMPPWGPDKITDDGREQLRALGFTI